jgi:uncharacterized protein YgiM (DUF1202 family)
MLKTLRLIIVRIKVSPLSSRSWHRLLGPSLLCLLSLVALGGCNRLRKHPPQYVYVQSKGTFLRDRVAAVSNKVTDVHNAERLLVLQHERRFYQVKTDDGKVGWLEEHAVIDQDAFDKFDELDTAHLGRPQDRPPLPAAGERQAAAVDAGLRREARGARSARAEAGGAPRPA